MKLSSAFAFLLIDLDDTLAPEWGYVAGGYRAAADALARATDQDSDLLFNLFVYEHMKYGRYRIMDRMVSALGMQPSLTQDLVRAYRDHAPTMEFYPGVRETLRQLVSSGFKLAVVTDGAVEVQRRKVEALDLEDLVDAVVYCQECNTPKPNAGAFRIAMERIGADPARTLIVGDDPFHDLGAAATLGMAACRVRTGRYGPVEALRMSPLADIAAFSDLPAWLNGNLR